MMCQNSKCRLLNLAISRSNSSCHKTMFTPGTHVTAASFSSFIQPSVYRKQSIYLLKVGVSASSSGYLQTSLRRSVIVASNSRMSQFFQAAMEFSFVYVHHFSGPRQLF